jgi:hypothetical protein
MYDTTSGRFVSRDPIAFRGGEINLYGYVSGRPLIGLDYSGRQFHTMPPTLNLNPEDVLGPYWFSSTWVADFFNHYYYEAGRDFDLAEYGLLENFRSSSQIRSQVTSYREWLALHTFAQAASLKCNNYPGAPRPTKTVANTTNLTYDFGLSGITSIPNAIDPLYPLGRPRYSNGFSVQSTCVISLDSCGPCCKGIFGKLLGGDDWLYSVSCTLQFSVRDLFTDPWNAFNTHPEGTVQSPVREPEDGVPTDYAIVGNWTETFQKSFSRPCPRK